MSYWDHVNPNEFLQGVAEGYDKPVRKQYREILQSLQPKTMLEVGCGPGVDFIGAVNTCPSIQYTGVDITEQMVQYCRQHYSAGLFYQANIFQLPFESGQFEFVYCKDVLNHVDEWPKAFTELLRVSQKYVLVNFFHGLGVKTVKQRIDHNSYINNYYDWNEVMSTMVSLKPKGLSIYHFPSPSQDDTLILFYKN
nr:class I SAM-dependent methyltransferase [Paenibacillus turpanensis]